jgi:DUF4097 and DUF4098 domain-containing protein YvlB
VKRSTKSMLFAFIVIAAILSVSAYAVIHHAMAPLAHRQDKTLYTPKENVEIQAATFNGNIEIQSTTGSQIEVIYNVTAPDGYLNDVKTFTNETQGTDLTTLITSATLQSSGAQASDYKASLLINLPNTSSYNLTLTTVNGDIIKPQLNDATVVATTNNGNIDLKDGISSSEIDAMTLNGNIKIGLTQGTLFKVTASVGNGNITHQGIQLDASTETATRLKGATSEGDGKLDLSLISGNGNVAISYLTP